jgi:peptide/nickel transport system permease protein
VFIKRLTTTLFLLWMMASLIFLGVYSLGNPVDFLIPPDFTMQERAVVMHELGLDQSFLKQYIIFMKSLFKGEMGHSFIYHQPAFKLILERLPASIELAFLAFLGASLVGIPLGAYLAIYPQKLRSKFIYGYSLLGISIPSYIFGLMCVAIFAVKLKYFPAIGQGETRIITGVPLSFMTVDGLKHLFLPLLTLVIIKGAFFTRISLSTTQEILVQEHVRYAMARGLTRKAVFLKHIFKNSLLGMLSIMGLELSGLITSLMMTEAVFSWPGVGKLLIDSVHGLDRPVILAYILFTGLLFMSISWIIDWLIGIIDPRTLSKVN